MCNCEGGGDVNPKPCKHEHWVIVDDEWNHDMICDLPQYKYCGFHGDCPDYEPKEESDDDD